MSRASPAGSMRKKLLWELTFQVLYVEVFKFPLDLAEQVHQVAPQRQRKLGVLQGSKRYGSPSIKTANSNNIPDHFLFAAPPSLLMNGRQSAFWLWQTLKSFSNSLESSHRSASSRMHSGWFCTVARSHVSLGSQSSVLLSFTRTSANVQGA